MRLLSIVPRIFRSGLWISFFLMICFSAFVPASETHELKVLENQVLPGPNLSIKEGDIVTWNATEFPIQITLQEIVKGLEVVEVVSGFQDDGKKQCLIAPVEANKKATLKFAKKGTYTYFLDGLNPGQTALMCGMDNLTHSVVGTITVE